LNLNVPGPYLVLLVCQSQQASGPPDRSTFSQNRSSCVFGELPLKRPCSDLGTATRWSGFVQEGLVLDHFRCNNKPCCNPAHLEPVTNEENVRRARRRQTHCNRGHPHNETNSYFTPDETRYCQACRYLAAVEMLKRRQSGVGLLPKLTQAERFWNMVDKSGGPESCWAGGRLSASTGARQRPHDSTGSLGSRLTRLRRHSRCLTRNARKTAAKTRPKVRPHQTPLGPMPRWNVNHTPTGTPRPQ